MMAQTTSGKIKSILELAEACKSTEVLNQNSAWNAFHRIFRVSVASNKMVIPEAFKAKIGRWFTMAGDESKEDALKRAELQTIVRIFDRWTFNQTMFNAARSCKPINNGVVSSARDTQASDTDMHVVKECDFCDPFNFTAKDTFGRLENKTCLTASNVAKYDAYHSMIVFKDHPPTNYFKEKLFDMFELAEHWFEIVHQEHPSAVYPIMNWNCQARAGASQQHGHAHLLLGENFHYGQWERLFESAKNYSSKYPGKNYIADFVEAHKGLGLAKSIGSATVLAHLVPYCGYEFKVISWNFDDDFKLAVHEAVSSLMYKFGSRCLNLCVHFPPFDDGHLRQPLPDDQLPGPSGKSEENEVLMPFMAHLVDRGDLTKGATSDICGMRIYGSAIVNEDPFKLAKQLHWDS